ncbi:MAG: hypothetical protein PW790_05030 [Parvibaculaceae bacterium]|nr:hypothetical protein [Parvibaculaceae bacterium]
MQDDSDNRYSIATPHWTPELLKRRRQRSVAIGLVLGAMVILFFSVTIVRLQANIAANHAIQHTEG